jgi:hypothetical protein
MVQPNILLIWGQVQYKFAPVFGYNVIGNITLSDQIYMSPRLTSSANYTDGPPCS